MTAITPFGATPQTIQPTGQPSYNANQYNQLYRQAQRGFMQQMRPQFQGMGGNWRQQAQQQFQQQYGGPGQGFQGFGAEQSLMGYLPQNNHLNSGLLSYLSNPFGSFYGGAPQAQPAQVRQPVQPQTQPGLPPVQSQPQPQTQPGLPPAQPPAAPVTPSLKLGIGNTTYTQPQLQQYFSQPGLTGQDILNRSATLGLTPAQLASAMNMGGFKNPAATNIPWTAQSVMNAGSDPANGFAGIGMNNGRIGYA